MIILWLTQLSNLRRSIMLASIVVSGSNMNSSRLELELRDKSLAEPNTQSWWRVRCWDTSNKHCVFSLDLSYYPHTIHCPVNHKLLYHDVLSPGRFRISSIATSAWHSTCVWMFESAFIGGVQVSESALDCWHQSQATIHLLIDRGTCNENLRWIRIFPPHLSIGVPYGLCFYQ